MIRSPFSAAVCLGLYVVVAAVIAMQAAVASAATSVDLPYSVDVGDRFAIEIRRETERDDQGGMARIVGTTPVTAEVVEELDSGWVFVWTYGNTAIVEDGDEPVAIADRETARLLDGISIEFDVDANGAPVRVRNIVDIRRHFRRFSANFVNAQVAEARREGADFVQVARLRRELRQRSSVYVRMTDNEVSQFALRDPSLLNRVAGQSFNNEEDSAETETANWQDGEADERARLRQSDARTGIAIIDWSRDERTFPTDSSANAGPPGTQPASTGSPIDTHWTAVFTVNTASGQVESVNAERVIVADDRRLIERTLMTQTNAPAALR